MTAPALGAPQRAPLGAELERCIDEASQAIAARLSEAPRLGIILGSGLGDVAELLDREGRVSVDYADIPNVPDSSVGGHAGQLIAGRVGSVPTVVLAGRVHPYEGYSAHEVTILARAVFALGLQTLVVTNAAGGLHHAYEPGDLMLMRDMINLSGDNPLRGPNLDRFGPRFPAMTDAFDGALRSAARRVAERERIAVREGVYVMLAGPNYETRAEMRMLRLLGADAVGMSTVPEVIVARHAGVRVLGVSVITNKEPADDDPGVEHDDVVEVSRRGAARIASILRGVLPELR